MVSFQGNEDDAAAQAQADSHARLAGILNAALDCIVTVDGDNRIIEFNPAAEKTFGYRGVDVIGQDMAELVIPPAYRAMHNAGMKRHLATGENRVIGRRIEITAMRSDGSEFPCELTIARLKIAGRPVFTAFLRDITEQKKAEEDVCRLNASLEQQVSERTQELRASLVALERTRERLEEAQEIARLGDIEMDLQTGVRMWSREVFKLYAFPFAPEPPPLEEVIARVHPSDQEALRGFLEKFKTKEASEAPDALEYRVIRSDGGIRWLRLTARINRRSGDERRVLSATVQGITQRKTLERELLTTIDRERELGRLKTSFLHMVTHEYRTPLGIISSSAQILERYFAKLDEDQRADHLREIRHNARRLSDLMEEVLFLGKTDSGMVVVQPQAVDLVPWLRSLANDVVTSLGAERDVRVTVEAGLARAMLDERLLRHAMTNLVSNALKYSTLDRAVTIIVRAATGWLTIGVRDEGIGIPPADQLKLFQMFQRASNVGTISGSGLGLVIAKRCVDLHGGTIEIESEPGRGTTVTVRFPQPAALEATTL